MLPATFPGSSVPPVFSSAHFHFSPHNKVFPTYLFADALGDVFLYMQLSNVLQSTVSKWNWYPMSRIPCLQHQWKWRAEWYGCPCSSASTNLDCTKSIISSLSVNQIMLFDFVAFHTVVLSISIYYGPSNTTLYCKECLIQLTRRHVSVSRWPSSGPQELWLAGYMQRNIL